MKLLSILLFSCSLAFSQSGKTPNPDRIKKFEFRQQAPTAPSRFDVRVWDRVTGGRATAVNRRSAAISPLNSILRAEYRNDVQIKPNRIGVVGLITHPAGAFTSASSEDAEAVAGDFLRRYVETLWSGAGETFTLTARRQVGDRTVFNFQQSIRGVPVFGGHASLAVNSNGQLTRGLFGEFSGITVPDSGERLSPKQVAMLALKRYGRVVVEDLVSLTATEFTSRFENPLGASRNPIDISLVVFPYSLSTATFAYRILLDAPGRSFDVVLDSTTGQLLSLNSGMRHAGTGRVWTVNPDEGPRDLVAFPDEWFSGDGAVTTGNNADVYRDSDGDDEPDALEGDGLKGGRAFSADQVFDFPGVDDNPDADPIDYPASALTNAFYLANRAHDHFYDLGFTEAVGNFQQDNLGRPGSGGDAVRVHVHGSLFGDTASFMLTPEGTPPRLELGFGVTEDLKITDAALSADLLFHEYSHGVSSRLVGGPRDLGCLNGLQSDGLSEGWSDYFALSLIDKPVTGAYIVGKSGGIRRQSYDGYTFTYEDLGNDGFDVPHDEGEIWAATLWDIRKEFGATVTDQLAYDGLSLTPCSPSMIHARDAVFEAARFEQRDKLWEIFARHGMGDSASGVDGWALEGTTFNASYDLPRSMSPGNRTPVVTSSPGLAEDVNSAYRYQISARDPDGDTLTYEMVEGPADMDLDPERGLINWTASFTGARAKVKVSDGNGGELYHGFFVPVITLLTRNVRTPIFGAARSEGWAGFVHVGVDPILQFTLRGGIGDADLFLVSPFGEIYESFNVGNDETLTIPDAAPGIWLVRVDGIRDYDATLTASGTTPSEVTLNRPMENRSGAETSERFYKITIPADVSLMRIRTYGGEGDVDLLGRRDGIATCQGLLTSAPCLFDEESKELGNNESIVLRDPAPGEYNFTLYGFEAYSGVTMVVETFATGHYPPMVAAGGVALATQTPVVSEVSPNAVFSIYGTDLAPEGTSALQPGVDADGKVSTVLANTCVELNGMRSAMFAVLPTQINAQASDKLKPGSGSLVVISGCDTAEEVRSVEASVSIQAASPGFFNFINNPDGDNPLAALHGGGPGLVGEVGLMPGVETTPAAPGEYISLYGTGFGQTDPPLEAGEIPMVRYPELSGQAPLAGNFFVSVGGVMVPPQDVYYAGAAPCCAGLQQFIFKVGDQTPDGKHKVVGSIDGIETPDGPYITVKKP
jgi:uncharacterized protein (TIGR03437 family)